MATYEPKRVMTRVANGEAFERGNSIKGKERTATIYQRTLITHFRDNKPLTVKAYLRLSRSVPALPFLSRYPFAVSFPPNFSGASSPRLFFRPGHLSPPLVYPFPDSPYILFPLDHVSFLFSPPELVRFPSRTGNVLEMAR